MDLINLKSVYNSIIFSVIGLVVLWISFFIFAKMTPGNFWKEILEEHNVPLAIIFGAMTIAIALIVSSAISG